MTIIIRHAAQLVGVTPVNVQRQRGAAMRDAGLIEDGALVVQGDCIAWVGRDADLPPQAADAEVIEAADQVVLPGFTDSHTHLIWAGSRADELDLRLQGLSYQQISARGGGILSTVRQVRQCSRPELVRLARPRLQRMLAIGVTTVEVKSGYGLTTADEVKCLEAVADLNADGPIELVPTFLGAHVVAGEFRTDRAGYLRLLCEEMLPEVARNRLAEYCDVFCETGVFDLAESERILTRAGELGLRLELHADELTPLGGAELAARLSATSADHLLCITEAGIEALAASNTVATLLPGTAFYLGLPYAPARQLLDRGLTVALASDCNPGTCPTENLPLIGTLACAGMGMTPAEVVNALTINAAAALDRADRLGSLTVGKQADVQICRVSDYRDLFSHFGVSHVGTVLKRGRVVYQA